MEAISWERRDDGVTFDAGGLVVRLRWEAPGIVRVAARPVHDGEPQFTDGLMLDPARPREPVEFRLRASSGGLVMSDETLTVAIHGTSGNLTWRDAHGRLLFDEAGQEARQVAAAVGDSGEGGYQARLGLRFSPGEALYGLGQHEEGLLDYRGRSQHLYQQNLKVPVPFLTSSRGWGLLWHGYSAMTFRDDQYGSYFHADRVEQLEYCVIAGADLHEVVAGYRRLTGAAPIPPRWAFGFVQSKERYRDQAEVLDTARRYAELGLPLECIVLDWQYWPEGQWGQKSFDPERFPDPVQMCDELHELGTRLMISVWPHLDGEGADHRELSEAGALLANDRTYNALDPAARGLFWRQIEKHLFEVGVDAWWFDCSEPFEPDWVGELEPTPDERRRINVEEAERYLGPLRSNAFSLEHSRGLWDGQRLSGSAKRVLNLTRSAWAGQQRYGTVAWSGDVSASWETLRRQVPEGLNFVASGSPYWTCDVGGFFTKRGREWYLNGDFEAGTADLGYRELFLRWFQYGTFLPMLRSHGTHTPREIWHFGEPGEAVYDALVSFIELRKALVPYLYSLAAEVYFDGATMMRPLAFDFARDPEALRVADQFMLGPSLLVCPVTRPQRYGPGSTPLDHAPSGRRVYLPEGRTWVDCWSGAAFEGGQWIDAPAPLEAIPVYAAAGAIIPFAPADGEPGDLDLLVVPGSDGEFALYEDEGDGWSYQGGAHARTRLRWDDFERTLTVDGTEGAFPGMPGDRRVRARLLDPGSGWRSGTTAPASARYRNRPVAFRF